MDIVVWLRSLGLGMASKILRRCPTIETPRSFRSSAVRLGRTVSSISFSRNALPSGEHEFRRARQVWFKRGSTAQHTGRGKRSGRGANLCHISLYDKDPFRGDGLSRRRVIGWSSHWSPPVIPQKRVPGSGPGS
jgi:hypothetical protein